MIMVYKSSLLVRLGLWVKSLRLLIPNCFPLSFFLLILLCSTPVLLWEKCKRWEKFSVTFITRRGSCLFPSADPQRPPVSVKFLEVSFPAYIPYLWQSILYKREAHQWMAPQRRWLKKNSLEYAVLLHFFPCHTHARMHCNDIHMKVEPINCPFH